MTLSVGCSIHQNSPPLSYLFGLLYHRWLVCLNTVFAVVEVSLSLGRVHLVFGTLVRESLLSFSSSMQKLVSFFPLLGRSFGWVHWR